MNSGRIRPSSTSTGSGGRALTLVAMVLAVALQTVVLVPFTVASGLVAPLWAVVGLYALGAASVLLLVRTLRRAPRWAPAIPVANGLLLWLAITAGERLLGWTA
jgi:hypothetical protein